MSILSFAIKMEKDGEEFYRNQARENKNNSLFSVFSILADDEKQHAKILSGFVKKERLELSDSEIANIKDIFKESFRSDIKQKPAQLDIYREALKMEEDSINLYKDLLKKSKESEQIEILNYLIKQEHLHFRTIEDLIFHLEKAESWVESAEFGVREDY